MASNAKDYKEKVRATVANGFQSLLLAIGHKLKLFDHLGSEAQPRSSQEIADLANYKERYVREWLSGLVVGGFVECDPSGKTFWLASAAKEAFKSEAVHAELVVGNMIPFFSLVFAQICDCFKLDGPRGIPYSACGPVHEMIASLSDPDFEATLVTNFVPSIPGLQDQLERGIACLDVGCGTGTVSLLLAARFPNSQFYGVDIGDEAVKRAFSVAREKALPNVQFVLGDAKQLPSDWTSKFDYVTAFDSIHDLSRPDLALLEIMRVLKPGARFSVVDIYARSNVYENKDDPKASFCYTASLFHCTPVSLYFPDGFGLGAMWGIEKATAILKEVGFQVQLLDKPVAEGQAHFKVHFLCTKPATTKA